MTNAVMIFLRMRTPSDQNQLLNPKKTEKNSGKKLPYYLFMNSYSSDFYKEILECYEYETRNPTIYGNVVRSEMEFTQSSKERNLTNKEMKITFNEYCAFHPPTWEE